MTTCRSGLVFTEMCRPAVAVTDSGASSSTTNHWKTMSEPR